MSAKICETITNIVYNGPRQNHTHVSIKFVTTTVEQFLDEKACKKINTILSSAADINGLIHVSYAINMIKVFIDSDNTSVPDLLNDMLKYLENCSCSKEASQLHDRVSSFLNQYVKQ